MLEPCSFQEACHTRAAFQTLPDTDGMIVQDTFLLTSAWELSFSL